MLGWQGRSENNIFSLVNDLKTSQTIFLICCPVCSRRLCWVLHSAQRAPFYCCCSAIVAALLNRLSVQFSYFAECDACEFVYQVKNFEFQTENSVKKTVFCVILPDILETQSWPPNHSPLFWRFHLSYQVGLLFKIELFLERFVFWNIFPLFLVS